MTFPLSAGLRPAKPVLCGRYKNNKNLTIRKELRIMNQQENKLKEGSPDSGDCTEPVIFTDALDQAIRNKGLSFETALRRMKNGGCLAREGWNGKDMYVYINRGSFPCPETNEDMPSSHRNIAIKLFELGDKGSFTRLPNLNMKTADDCVLVGWIPTQTDLLSDDWYVVEDRIRWQ
jgi:hypothetical protein